MNKTRFGHCEISVSIWLVGLLPLLIVFMFNPPFIIFILVFVNIIFGLFAITYLPYLISRYSLRPGLDKCKRNETTWLRITKDHIIMPQFVDKGPYGQTKGVTYREKADVVDDGSFPVKWRNGNPGIIMYDLMNTSVDLRKSVARKQIQREHGVRNGVEAYEKAKKEGEVLFDFKGGK
jgi:hypothetical protein